MKTNRILSLLLVLALAFSFAPGFASREAFASAENEKSWSVRFTDVDLASFGVSYATPFGYTDQGIYCNGSEVVGTNMPEGAVEEYKGQYDVYSPVLLFLSYEGEVQKLDYTPFKMEREHPDKYSYESDCYMQGVKLLPDGSIAELSVFSESWCDDPNLTREDDAFWEAYHYSNEYYLRHLRADGTEEAIFLIPTLADDYVGTFSSDSNGNVICAMSGKLLSISTVDGSLNWMQNLDLYPDRILTLRGGEPAFICWAEDGMYLYPVNADNGEIGAPLAIPSDAYTLFSGGGDYPLYYSNGSGLFGVQPGSREKTFLLSWINLGIAVEAYGEFCVREDGTVIGVLDGYTDGTGYADARTLPHYRIFTAIPGIGEPDGKTHLTYATPWLDYDKRAEVMRFNKTSEDYTIDILDYYVFNTDVDWDAGVRKLEEDLLSGAVAPDLIDLASLNVENLVAHGILEDLYPYLDASDGIQRDDFFPTVLGAAEIGGKLYYTVPGFCVSTVLGDSSVVGENPGWNYRTFRSVLSAHPSMRAMSIYTTAGDVFSTCFSMDFSRYVDLVNGTCSFENGDFLDLVSFAALFPAEYTWENYEYEADNDVAGMANGKQLLYQGYLSSAHDAVYYGAVLSDRPYTYIGYPVPSGTGSFFTFQPGIAINASSAHKDVAWSYLSRYFTEETQSAQYLLPSNRNAFLAKLEEMKQVSYREDADGNLILDESGQPIPEPRTFVSDGSGNDVKVYALTQEDADRLLQLVETTTRHETNRDGLNSLVEEQAAAFFRGEQSAEEAARNAQESVTAWLQENAFAD